MKQSISSARKTHWLEGFSIYASENVRPTGEELRAIVESAGAHMIKETPREFMANLIVLLNPDEYSLQFRMRHLGYTLFTPEMLISGCLTQHMDVLN